MIHPQAGIDTVLVAPTNGAANTNAKTASWDIVQTDGSAKYAEIRMLFAAELNTSGTGPTISLLESDDTVVTNHATIDSNFERSAEDLTSAKEVRYLVNLLGRKRYLRLTITPVTDTNSVVDVGVVGTLTRTGVGPGSTTDLGDDVVIIG
jgi:hypothetical protein